MLFYLLLKKGQLRTDYNTLMNVMTHIQDDWFDYSNFVSAKEAYKVKAYKMGPGHIGIYNVPQ